VTTHIALLRAINLGGHNKVAMADLRRLCTQLGLDDPRTALQSGNLVFRATARAAASLERLLEGETEQRLSLRTDFFVRSAAEWQAVIAANPFRAEAAQAPSRLLVMFLKDEPGPGQVRALQAAIAGPEMVRARGRQAYIVYPDGFGGSRLTNAVIEAKLGTRSTGRNWNTVLRLGALAAP
jgi:uncharacterized protein (DUF1697 family)